jgi:RNA polymerase sigma-70 factor (ECF subfamily)
MCEGQPPDAVVIQRCRRGEVELFRVLVKRYEDRIYSLAVRLLDNPEEALDAAQDTFVRAFRALEQFDAERPFAPWLYRIATNTCVGLLRKRRPDVFSLDAMPEYEAETALAAASADTDPWQRLERTLRDEEIQCAVMALPEAYRMVILLRYTDELSYEEIAAALELPLGTVKTLLHRAHRRLRATLERG